MNNPNNAGEIQWSDVYCYFCYLHLMRQCVVRPSESSHLTVAEFYSETDDAETGDVE